MLETKSVEEMKIYVWLKSINVLQRKGNTVLIIVNSYVLPILDFPISWKLNSP